MTIQVDIWGGPKGQIPIDCFQFESLNHAADCIADALAHGFCVNLMYIEDVGGPAVVSPEDGMSAWACKQGKVEQRTSTRDILEGKNPANIFGLTGKLDS